MLGPLAVIWQSIEKYLDTLADPAVKAWVKKHEASLDVFEAASKLPADDPRRLAVLEPRSVKLLLKSENKGFIASHFPLIEELIMLRRNASSNIPRDEEGTSFCELSKMMKPHQMLTRVVQRRDEEEAEFQWLHHDAAR